MCDKTFLSMCDKFLSMCDKMFLVCATKRFLAWLVGLIRLKYWLNYLDQIFTVLMTGVEVK